MSSGYIRTPLRNKNIIQIGQTHLSTYSDVFRLLVHVSKQRSAGNNLVIQLAPSAFHQANAMLSLLKRYSWKQFSIVTSTVAGYREFIQAVTEAAYKFESQNSYKYKIICKLPLSFIYNWYILVIIILFI